MLPVGPGPSCPCPRCCPPGRTRSHHAGRFPLSHSSGLQQRRQKEEGR
ncbi:hypothetical protein Nmel_015091 [Mimus melanotis]